MKDLQAAGEGKWLESEFRTGCLKDVRLEKRFKILAEQLWKGLGSPLPVVCQDWTNTKAAYRFLSNERVTEDRILQGHFQATQERFKAQEEGWILVLQDTTEISYHREEEEGIGLIRSLSRGKDLFGKPTLIKKCGILMHASLAVTTDGLPLGLTAIKFWTRQQFKGTNALKKHINPTRVPIEEKESYRWLENLRQSTLLLQQPDRCVHIGDRESDIYELFCTAQKLGTNFVVRTCVDRLSEDGKKTIAKQMSESPIRGTHTIELYNAKDIKTQAILEIKYQQLNVLPPVGKQKKYPSLPLTVIYAQEPDAPAHRDRIVWKLITNLAVSSLQEAIEKLNWYAQRWKIETFHKILKSGCKVEMLKLRTAQRLTNLIAIFCLLSWRIFWLTMMNRYRPHASPQLALTKQEIDLLDQLVKDKTIQNAQNKNLSYYLIKIAQLGGYLARKSDPPPGNIVMWRGMTRLALP